MVKRIIYPPMWLVFGIVAIFALNEFYPGPRFTGLGSQLVGGAILVAGLALLGLAGGLSRPWSPGESIASAATPCISAWLPFCWAVP